MSQSAREKDLHVPASLHSSQSVQYMYTLLVVDNIRPKSQLAE